MRVSVIIPVHNAERYVDNAVQSALQQPETGEVILIEDGSPDNCLMICRELEDRFGKVRLLRHPDGKNHGAGATRNLGIKHTRYDYIAFLDADDFYLPERFKIAKKLFKIHDDIDGVYEAIGTHFYEPRFEQKLFINRTKSFTTLKAGIDGGKLFEALARGKSGFFSLDGLVVKRSLLKRCGYFFEHLKLHQDTAIIIQMSFYGKLVPGQLDKPVAMRGVHNEKLYLWQTLFAWAQKRKMATRRLIILFHNYCYSLFKLFRETRHANQSKRPLLRSLIHEISRHPILAVGALLEYISRKIPN
jgi:glycosyltransferase involved in cell wall biosynthesis